MPTSSTDLIIFCFWMVTYCFIVVTYCFINTANFAASLGRNADILEEWRNADFFTNKKWWFFKSDLKERIADFSHTFQKCWFLNQSKKKKCWLLSYILEMLISQLIADLNLLTDRNLCHIIITFQLATTKQQLVTFLNHNKLCFTSIGSQQIVPGFTNKFCQILIII